jgi:hypothetical protein
MREEDEVATGPFRALLAKAERRREKKTEEVRLRMAELLRRRILLGKGGRGFLLNVKRRSEAEEAAGKVAKRRRMEQILRIWRLVNLTTQEFCNRVYERSLSRRILRFIDAEAWRRHVDKLEMAREHFRCRVKRKCIEEWQELTKQQMRTDDRRVREICQKTDLHKLREFFRLFADGAEIEKYERLTSRKQNDLWSRVHELLISDQ